MCGLTLQDRAVIVDALARFPEIERAILFGSRAMGNFKVGSDIDIAIAGHDVTQTTVSRLGDWLNEVAPLPYVFDVILYDAISHAGLRQHIDNRGIVIYPGIWPDPTTADRLRR